MHEYGLAEGVLATVRQRAAGRKVAGIRVRFGVKHAVNDESMAQAWGFVAEGTEAEGSAVALVTVPAMLTCLDCGLTAETTDVLAVCPGCNGDNVEITGGDGTQPGRTRPGVRRRRCTPPWTPGPRRRPSRGGCHDGASVRHGRPAAVRPLRVSAERAGLLRPRRLRRLPRVRGGRRGRPGPGPAGSGVLRGVAVPGADLGRLRHPRPAGPPGGGGLLGGQRAARPGSGQQDRRLDGGPVPAAGR